MQAIDKGDSKQKKMLKIIPVLFMCALKELSFTNKQRDLNSVTKTSKKLFHPYFAHPGPKKSNLV